jgi:L-asparaginase
MEQYSKGHSVVVHVLREGLVESIHFCHAVVTDHRGRVLLKAGNEEYVTFARSALKPFQALPIMSSGAYERFNLSEADLALICGSHDGSMEHQRRAFNILWRCDLEPNVLTCPTPKGQKTPLAYNCSGKHSGMLAVCRMKSWQTVDYASRRHPVQQQIGQTLAELIGLPAEEFITARDDCGVPTYQMPLSQLAWLYAQLGSSKNPNLEYLARAMNRHPRMVAGEGQFDTVLMSMLPSHLVSKGGAEGVQCIANLEQGMGLAIKVQDGSSRAKRVAAIHLLTQLGWIDPSMAEDLKDEFAPVAPYSRLEVVGELA